MTEHNPLKIVREALEAAPIIGLWEDAEAFKVRQDNWLETKYREAADRIEQLEREKAAVSDLWEQQKEIALDYLTDCNKAVERIEALEAEIEEWRACARYDAMMEGPAFKGWDMSALERCRRAALQEQSK